MIPDESARRLHDRVTRGGALSPPERAQLDEWLAAQDQSEARMLSSKGFVPALADLRSQVDSTLEQVSLVTQNIQQLSSENDSLRREIAALRSRVAGRPVSQPA